MAGVALAALCVCLLAACSKRGAPHEAAAEKAAPSPGSQTNPEEPKAPPPPEDEAENVADDGPPMRYRLAIGPAGVHQVHFERSEDGTDILGRVTLASSARFELGSIQRKYHDQVQQLIAVESCQRDGDPALELCVKYAADPLGSTREDPYQAETVFDWRGAGFAVLPAPSSPGQP